MLREHRGFTLVGDKAGNDLLWVPAAHSSGYLSHDGDVVLVSVVQLRIEVVAAGQFSSGKGPGSPFGFSNCIPALQKISVSVTTEAQGVFGEGINPVNPEEQYGGAAVLHN